MQFASQNQLDIVDKGMSSIIIWNRANNSPQVSIMIFQFALSAVVEYNIAD
jgi:hypothetical protein